MPYFIPRESFSGPRPSAGPTVTAGITSIGSMFGPIFGIFGFLLGAGVGAQVASSEGRKLKRIAIANMERTNEVITQMRVRAVLDMDQVAREGRVEEGRAFAVADRNLASVQTIAQRVAANVARDTETIRTDLRHSERAAEFEKQNAVLGFESQAPNATLAALESGLSFASTFGGFGESIAQAIDTSRLASLAKQAGLSNVDLARLNFQSSLGATAFQLDFSNFARSVVDFYRSRITSSDAQSRFGGSAGIPGPGLFGGPRRYR